MAREGVYVDTTLREILGLEVGDRLTAGGGSDLPDYDAEDAGKSLVVNSDGTGLEWESPLPSYSESDKGKVLGIAEDAEHTTEKIVITEQVVTVSSGSGSVQRYDEDFFANVQNGDVAVLTVNGTDYNVTAVVSGEGVVFSVNNEPPGIACASDGTSCVFSAETDGDYTISLTASVPSVAPAWVEGGTLPEYTDADEGKVLTLVEDAEHPQTINIVPTQTVVLTVDDIAAELTGYDFSGVSLGDTLTLTVDDHSESVTVITGGGVDLAVAATYSVQGGQQTVQIGFVDGVGAGFDCLFRGTGSDVSTRKPGTYTVSLTKSVPSVAPAWTNALPSVTDADNGDVLTVVDGAWDKAAPSGAKIVTFSNGAEGDVATGLNAALTNMNTGSLDRYIIAFTDFTNATAEDLDKVVAIGDGAFSGDLYYIDLLGNIVSPILFTQSENNYVIQYVVPFYRVDSSTVVRITLLLSASKPGKLFAFQYCLAVERLSDSIPK